MKKLVLGDHGAVPGAAGARGLRRRAVCQGRHRDRMGRSRAGVDKKTCAASDQPEGRRPVQEPRQAARAGQGRHVQCLRVGQLLPRAGHRQGQPPARPPRHRQLMRRWSSRRIRRSIRRSRWPTRWSACRSISARIISRCTCSKVLCRATDQAVPAPNGSRYRLDAHDEGRARRDDADRAAHHARREEGLPHHLLGLFPRHRGRLRPRRRRDLCAPSIAPCAKRCAASTPTRRPTCTTSSTITARRPGGRGAEVEDLRESRIVVCDPAPIPVEEMQRTYDWLKSWGMLEETASPLQLVNTQVQSYAHNAAE